MARDEYESRGRGDFPKPRERKKCAARPDEQMGENTQTITRNKRRNKADYTLLTLLKPRN